MSVNRTKGKGRYRKTERNGVQQGGRYENVFINGNKIGDYMISTLIGTHSRRITNLVSGVTTTPTNALASVALSDPRAIVMDTAGVLYVTSHSSIIKIVPPAKTTYMMKGNVATAVVPPPHTSESVASIYAGYNSSGDPAPGADMANSSGDEIRFYNLWGMLYDPAENCLYVSDCQVHKIAKIYTDSGGKVQCKLITTQTLDTPKGIALGVDGALYIADNKNNRVCKVTKGGVFSVIGETIIDPQGVALDTLGNVYVSSGCYGETSNGHCIYILTPNAAGTTYTQKVYAGEKGKAEFANGSLLGARFNTPQAIYYEPAHNYLYVYDGGNRRIRLINMNTETVSTVVAGDYYDDGSVNRVGKFRGSWDTAENTIQKGNQASYSGIVSDPNGIIYITDWANNNLVRQIVPVPESGVAEITKAEYDAYWDSQRASSAVAENASSALMQTTSSARESSAVAEVTSSARASSAVAQDASSAVAQVASSAVAQVASSAVASSALAQDASSAVAQTVSSALAQSISGAQESSATAQDASSAVAQTVSSALAQSISGAQESSATAQDASSAVAQTVSSALAQKISGAEESSARAQDASSAVAQTVSSALAQKISGAQESSATAQDASSALAQSISGAQASSATAQRASSSLAQSISGAQASSAVAQRASSSLMQQISGAEESSARAQDASSAVAQRASSSLAERASSAVAQRASSAFQQQALIRPVAKKDAIVADIQGAQQYIDSQIVVLYSPSSSPSEVDAAKEAIIASMADLQHLWELLSQASATIFAIAPLYQDRVLQSVIPDPYLTSLGYTKLYDTMRNGYVVIDTNGYLVQNIDLPSNRLPPQQKGGAVAAGTSGLYTTDILLTGDSSLPENTPWKSYFDSIARRYFYVNSSTGASQYEHPFPPVFSGSHTIVTDTTVKFLPSGWVKLQSVSPAIPYYFNINTMQSLWVHPNPPPNPSSLIQMEDTTLFSSYKKYIDPTTTKPFYVNSATLEAQWNFPASAFNIGPSSAASMAVASSAVAQTVSSALAQSISGARESSATAETASSAVAQTVSSAREQFASSAEQQEASSAMYQTIVAATVSYRYILLTIYGPRISPNDTVISGFFLNLTRVPNPWNAAARATAVDPVTFAQLNDATGAPIVYENLFDNTLTKTTAVKPSGTYPTAILIDNTVPISFNSYYFGTGPTSGSDMIQWTLKGSKDTLTFVMIDDKTSPQFSLVTDVRNSFTPEIELTVGQNLVASSAFKQMASSARVSSAVAQTVSSALAQSISGAQQSSAVAQTVSSALAQSISGAEESSARAQDASSALAQSISGARESSATAQTVSSALAQSISGAEASSAVAETVSSARQQTASSAQLEDDFMRFIAEKDGIKSELQGAQAYITDELSNVYRKNNSVTMATLSDLQKIIGEFILIKEQLIMTGEKILRLHNHYQDPDLQTSVASPTLSEQGLKKFYDTLRNTYIVVDSRGDIVPNTETPRARKGISDTQQYGGAPKLSRKVSRVHS